MRALVTGGNGHVGLALCRALVERPATTVRASVRSLEDASKVAPLRELGVEVVALDIRDLSQFIGALRGIDTLFHVAANYTVFAATASAKAAIVNDTVEGAENAIRAAARAGVAKVVLTSSVVTLPLVPLGAPEVTENDWLGDTEVPYFKGKVEGERAAWRLAKELGVQLVTVLPGGVGGPGFLRRTPTIDLFEGMMLGTLRFGAPRANFSYVDVRDVASGHILAASRPVGGRFILNAAQPSFMEYTQLMHGIDPAVPVSLMELPDFLLPLLPKFDVLNARMLGSARFVTPESVASIAGVRYNLSSARAQRELGWQPQYPLVDSLRDTMGAIRELRRREGKRRLI